MVSALMPYWTTERLLRALDSSRLVPGDTVRALSESAASSGRPASDLLGGLIESGELTRWQAEQLLAGGRSFHLGKYRLLDFLGRGGMGLVFKARHLVLDREVAVKVIRSSVLKGSSASQRFEREVRAAAALDHEHIVRALDADVVEGMHLLVMEYVEGVDLDRLQREHGSLPASLVCEIARQAALGLQHAFDRGLVHRDVKPGNLICTRSESGAPLVKILDFGLASYSLDAALTVSGEVLGTPDFMAPEQAEDSRSADLRADLFSLGCVMFFLISGRTPFEGTTLAEKLAARVLRRAPRLSSVGVDVSPDLDDLVHQLLEREPRHRVQTGTELARRLAPLAASPAELSLGVSSHGTSARGPDGLEEHPELDEVIAWLDSRVDREERLDADEPSRPGPSRIDATPSPSPLPVAERPEPPARVWSRSTRTITVLVLTIVLVLLLVVLFLLWRNFDGNGSSGPTASTPVVDSGPALQIDAFVVRDGSRLRLVDALPLETGDEIEFRGAVPADGHASFFWLDAVGQLYELELSRSADGDRARFTSPLAGKLYPLEDPPGTELVFLVWHPERVSSKEQIAELLEPESPTPALESSETLRFDHNETRVEGTRGPGSPRTAHAARARVETLRKRLLSRYALVEGLAFPHAARRRGED